MTGANPPLIAHVIHHLVIGGLENGLVNLINAMPAGRYRHVVICMVDYSDFRERIERDDVEVLAMHKKPGQDPRTQWRLYRLLRRLRPDILHTRNLTALDALLPATLAGIGRRLHGEHGRDMDDLHGDSRKHQWLRRLHRPMIKHYIAVSKDLERYLVEKIGVAPGRITQIYNGVDTQNFRPAADIERAGLPVGANLGTDKFVIGTVGRLQSVKNQLLLAQAFARLLARAPELRQTARLAIVGDGPMRADIDAFLAEQGIADLCWLPGARSDVADIYRGLDLFVLPSLGEGISNTILEAMASGLPVVATAVGGSVELVDDERTGCLVPAADAEVLSRALERYVRDPARRREHGRAARATAQERFSLDTMVQRYLERYDALMQT